MRPHVCAGLLLLLTAPGFSQTEFEVASIKPYERPQPVAGRAIRIGGPKTGGPGTKDPGRITWDGASLKNVLMEAFGMKAYQVICPEWLGDARFSFAVKVPEGATKEHARLMWQNLLVERFHLKAHRDTKDLPAYELSLGKGEPKMTESAEAAHPAADSKPVEPGQAPRYTERADGCRMPPPGVGGASFMMSQYMMRVCAARMTVESLASLLTGQLNKPVIDKTGLTKFYDFKLEFEPENSMGMMSGPAPMGADSAPVIHESAPPLTAAVAAQLGLKMEAKKLPTEVVIVDSMDKVPTEN